jgi:hypothetical protein
MAYRNIYGTQESNGLENGAEYHKISRDMRVDWADKNLQRITRLRLLSDPGFPMWDVSYCHGILMDGTEVVVELPFDQLPKHNMKSEIIRYAKQDNLYVKGLGIFEALVPLIES